MFVNLVNLLKEPVLFLLILWFVDFYFINFYPDLEYLFAATEFGWSCSYCMIRLLFKIFLNFVVGIYNYKLPLTANITVSHGFWSVVLLF